MLSVSAANNKIKKKIRKIPPSLSSDAIKDKKLRINKTISKKKENEGKQSNEHKGSAQEVPVHAIQSDLNPTIVKMKGENVAGVVESGAIDRAVRALLAVIEKSEQKSDTKDLLGDSNYVNLTFSLKLIPNRPLVKPIRIKVFTYICPHLKNNWQKVDFVCWNGSDLEFVALQVIGLGKLRKKFWTFQSRRELCSAFDLFLCDAPLITKMPTALGKFFIIRRKLPLPVNLAKENLNNIVEEAVKTTCMRVPTGPSVTIKIARVNMPQSEIVDNAKKVIETVIEFFNQEGPWKNIVHTINIQATNTIALPIYVHSLFKETLQKNLNYISKKNIGIKKGKTKQNNDKRTKTINQDNNAEANESNVIFKHEDNKFKESTTQESTKEQALDNGNNATQKTSEKMISKKKLKKGSIKKEATNKEEEGGKIKNEKDAVKEIIEEKIKNNETMIPEKKEKQVDEQKSFGKTFSRSISKNMKAKKRSGEKPIAKINGKKKAKK